MTDEELHAKVDSLTRRTDAYRQGKAAVEGELAAKKRQLEELLAEIRAEGVDPKNLLAERDLAREELERLVATYDAEISQAEAALAKFKES